MNKGEKIATVLLLTNLTNEDPEEDMFLLAALRKAFHVLIAHPLDCARVEKYADGVLIRNIWPTHEYQAAYRRFARRLQREHIRVYNPLAGKGDQRGKGYLADLFQQGFPVVPTVRHPSQRTKLPAARHYFLRPQFGADGSGSTRVSRRALSHAWKPGMLIQPFLEITEELGLYFLDNTFLYAIREQDKLQGTGVRDYTPTADEMRFAAQFVRWNGLPYGLQRIDMLRTKSGKLLLGEIEDLCPYLFLLDVGEGTRSKVLRALLHSLHRFLMETKSPSLLRR